MRRIAVTISVNILIWRVAIVEYSPMATFVNGVEQTHYPGCSFIFCLEVLVPQRPGLRIAGGGGLGHICIKKKFTAVLERHGDIQMPGKPSMLSWK